MKILITAGPTREYLDSVRYISNASTGTMGFSLAKAAARRGHEVIVVAGPVSLRLPETIRRVDVTSASEMLAASQRAFRGCDAAIFTAAVCDYRPLERALTKRPKHQSHWKIAMEPTTDIAAALGQAKSSRVTICFAMEDEDGRARAARKLESKNADAVVLNHVSTAGSPTAAIEILTPDGQWKVWQSASKAVVAGRIIRVLEQLPRTAARLRQSGNRAASGGSKTGTGKVRRQVG